MIGRQMIGRVSSEFTFPLTNSSKAAATIFLSDIFLSAVLATERPFPIRTFDAGLSPHHYAVPFVPGLPTELGRKICGLVEPEAEGCLALPFLTQPFLALPIESPGEQCSR